MWSNVSAWSKATLVARHVLRHALRVVLCASGCAGFSAPGFALLLRKTVRETLAVLLTDSRFSFVNLGACVDAACSKTMPVTLVQPPRLVSSLVGARVMYRVFSR